MWSSFHFKIHLGDVLGDDSEAEKLDAAYKYDDAYGRWPAGYGIAEDDCTDYDEDQHDEGYRCHGKTYKRDHFQRGLGKIDYTVEAVFQ